MKHILALSLLLANCTILMSQTVVTGNVSEADSEVAIAGANVLVKNLKGKLIGFDTSDENGDFSIKINESADSLIINSTMIGYKSFSRTISIDENPIIILM